MVLAGLVVRERGALAAAAEPVRGAGRRASRRVRSVTLAPGEAAVAEDDALAVGDRRGDRLVDGGEVQHGAGSGGVGGHIAPGSYRSAGARWRSASAALQVARTSAGRGRAEAAVRGAARASSAARDLGGAGGARPARRSRRSARRRRRPRRVRRRRSGSRARARGRTTGARSSASSSSAGTVAKRVQVARDRRVAPALHAVGRPARAEERGGARGASSGARAGQRERSPASVAVRASARLVARRALRDVPPAVRALGVHQERRRGVDRRPLAAADRDEPGERVGRARDVRHRRVAREQRGERAVRALRGARALGDRAARRCAGEHGDVARLGLGAARREERRARASAAATAASPSLMRGAGAPRGSRPRDGRARRDDPTARRARRIACTARPASSAAPNAILRSRSCADVVRAAKKSTNAPGAARRNAVQEQRPCRRARRAARRASRRASGGGSTTRRSKPARGARADLERVAVHQHGLERGAPRVRHDVVAARARAPARRSRPASPPRRRRARPPRAKPPV